MFLWVTHQSVPDWEINCLSSMVWKVGSQSRHGWSGSVLTKSKPRSPKMVQEVELLTPHWDGIMPTWFHESFDDKNVLGVRGFW